MNQISDGTWIVTHSIGDYPEEYVYNDRGGTTITPQVLTIDDLKKYTVHAGNTAQRKGESLPTVAEVWNILKGTQCILWVELKRGGTREWLECMEALNIPMNRVVPGMVE